MKLVDYEDKRGRWYRVSLPDTASDLDAPDGIPIGPPDVVDCLTLPEEVKAKVHNELFYREVWSFKTAARGNILQEALGSALSIDASRLLEAYKSLEKL